MIHDFTMEELDAIHLSLVTRDHKITKDWIENNKNIEEVKKYTAEVNMLRNLRNKVCAAKLSRQLGFYVEPLVESVG